MPLIMLKPSWQGTFRRSVKNGKGKSDHVLEFQPGLPLDIEDDADMQAIGDAIGDSLVVVTKRDGKGEKSSSRVGYRVDWLETQEIALSVALGQRDRNRKAREHNAKNPTSRKPIFALSGRQEQMARDFDEKQVSEAEFAAQQAANVEAESQQLGPPAKKDAKVANKKQPPVEGNKTGGK